MTSCAASARHRYRLDSDPKFRRPGTHHTRRTCVRGHLTLPARAPAGLMRCDGSLLAEDLLYSPIAVKIRRSHPHPMMPVMRRRCLPPPMSPDERIIAEHRLRERKWRGHIHAYLAVNGGLLMMNGLTTILSGVFAPWSLFGLFGWGIGLTIHTLNHRLWVQQNRTRVLAAEAALGIGRDELHAPLTRGIAAPVSADDPWPALLASCKEAVDRTQKILAEVHPAAINAQTDLTEGLASVRKLGAASERITSVLATLAPDGSSGLDQQIEALDCTISEIEDEGLKETHLANRALLVARRAKIDALRKDRDRMLAKAQGFLLTVENLHLDAARLTDAESAEALSAPIGRLTEEVEILSRVDQELKQLAG